MYNLQRQIGPRVRSNGIIPLTDTLSWQLGKHYLKIGAEWDRRLVTFGQARAPRGCVHVRRHLYRLRAGRLDARLYEVRPA